MMSKEKENAVRSLFESIQIPEIGIKPTQEIFGMHNEDDLQAV